MRFLFVIVWREMLIVPIQVSICLSSESSNFISVVSLTNVDIVDSYVISLSLRLVFILNVGSF